MRFPRLSFCCFSCGSSIIEAFRAPDGMRKKCRNCGRVWRTARVLEAKA